MRIVRLAQLLDNKYDLKIMAGTKEDEQKINDVRQEILDAYNNYFNNETAKPAYNILPLLAGQGEKYSKQLIALMEDLVNDVDTLDLFNLFQGIQNILAVINNLQEGERLALRASIDDAIPLKNETYRNMRTMAKSKFENTVFKKVASILLKLSKKLNIMLGKTMPLVGGPTEPEVKEPTKQEQFMFRQCPLAVMHHLDNPDIFGKLWLMPDLRRRLIRVMNRGKNRWATLHTDPEIMAETKAIMDEFKRRQTNEGYFEAGEDAAKEMARPKFVSPELKKEVLQQQQLQQQLKQEEQDKLQKAVQQRDEAHQRRQEEQRKIDEEEELANKYSATRLQEFLKRYL